MIRFRPTRNHAPQLSLSTAPLPRSSQKPALRNLSLLITTLLLLSFIAQWPGPRMADWQLFSFYDPGTILKGDLLLQKGYLPTIDFGYTHGLIPLLYGRLGFSLFGRTPWTFLFLTLLTEFAMAYALARILIATAIAQSRPALLFVLISLPMAIMPAYLTLTHPLEAMLILLALAAQAEGNKPTALATITGCLFVKPSMAYIYGLLLVLMILWESRKRPARIFQQFLPAALALIILALILAARFTWLPVFNTLLPFTGANTYATTGFGFFSAATREQFWLPDTWYLYIAAPGSIYLLASLATAIGALIALPQIFLRPARVPENAASLTATHDTELLFTIGCLNTAFILGFYGYPGSWHYYSYLPVLGAALFMLLLLRGRARSATFLSATIAMALSHIFLIIITIGAWTTKSPTPPNPAAPAAAPGLWHYNPIDNTPSLYQQWSATLQAVGTAPTLVMTNGYLFNLPPTIQMPDAWFPEPGIPTQSEIARVIAQAQKSDFIILFGNLTHENVDLWNSPAFANIRPNFTPIPLPTVTQFTLLHRTTAQKNP